MNVFLNEFCKLFFLFYFPDAMVQIEWTLIIKFLQDEVLNSLFGILEEMFLFL